MDRKTPKKTMAASEEVTAPLGAPLADSEPAITRCARRSRETPAPARPPAPPPTAETAETFQLLPSVVAAPAPPSGPSPTSLEEANSAASVCLTVFDDREAPPRREAKVPPGSPPREPSPASAPRALPPTPTPARSVAGPPLVLIASGLLGLSALVFLGALALLGGPSATPPRPVDAAALDGPVFHSVRLTSSPSGAEVFEGAEHLGRTPLQLSRQLGARAQVRLVLPGRRPVERSVGFFRDDEVSVAFDDDGVRRAGREGTGREVADEARASP